jgi:hypothetical protein
MDDIEQLFFTILLVVVIITFIRYTKTKSVLHSNWNQYLDKFSYSSEDIYKQLESKILDYEVQNLKTKLVTLTEGNEFSDSRMYLRISRKDYHFYICASPFGNSFFISWWLEYLPHSNERFVGAIPLIGRRLQRMFYPLSYYRMDSISMFQKLTHSCVTEVLDGILKEAGYKGEGTLREKPKVADFFRR